MGVRSGDMINFIICDDNLEMRSSVLEIVTKFMIAKELEYKTYLYEDYDEEFMKIVNKKLPFKIYILDIEAPTRTGIDVARIIRHKDEDSAIIFITGHEELGPRLLAKDITFLAFINKFDDYQTRLKINVQKAISALEKKKRLHFEDHGTIYSLPLRDILYIMKDTLTRKTIIVTEFNQFPVSKSLAYFQEELGEEFVQTHRSCLINRNRTIGVNKKDHTVILDNGMEVNLISTRFKVEELIEAI